MNNTKVSVSEFKKIMSKMSMGVEKTNINPDAGYVEIETVGENTIQTKVSSKDYFIVSALNAECGDEIRVTVNADTFIGVISKLDVESVELRTENNALVMSTKTAEYTFPIITNEGAVKELSSIPFDDDNAVSAIMNGEDIESVAGSNLQGLVDTTFSREVQQFIYVDNIGALTFTENVYVNDFKSPSEKEFKFLLNAVQTNLLKVFSNSDKVGVSVQNVADDGDKVVVKFESDNPKITLICITQTPTMTNSFPAAKIRGLSTSIKDIHVIINKSKLEKALNRLLVFDKKNSPVRDKSQFVFGTDSVTLVSRKHHNKEVVNYDKQTNAEEYTATIYFSDMINQLKAITTPNVDISYGNGKTVILNSNIKQLIPELRVVG